MVVLLPRMVKILMEDLIPIFEAARTFVQKRAGNRVINIGLDSAILIGHLAAISSSLLLVPIAILLEIILPGNRVILFADLAVIPFVVALAAPIVNGNVLRMVIIGTVTLIIGFCCANATATLFTHAAVAAGFHLPENAAYITAIGDGFIWISWASVALTTVFGFVCVAVIAVLTFAGIFTLKRVRGAKASAQVSV